MAEDTNIQPMQSDFEQIKKVTEKGKEYWSARELAPVLDYAKWENFQKTISRAMIACENSGHSVSDDFPEVRKIVEAAKAFLL
jgi:DNA-damage-inducible protein D